MCRYFRFVIAFLFLLSCSQRQKKNTASLKNNIPIQITINSTAGIYKETMIFNNTKKTMEFGTYPVDSGRYYSTMSYHTDSPLARVGIFSPRTNLTDEFVDIKKLWDSAKTRINIDLRWVLIDRPDEYKDIFKNYISLIQKSPIWKNYFKKNKRPDLSKVPLEPIFQEGNIYQSFNSFLKTFGYSIVGYSTEESYYLTRRFLQANGYDSTLTIPMPLIFGLRVKHE